MDQPRPTPTGGWHDPEQVDWYTDRNDTLAPRHAGEAALLEVLPDSPRSLVDLGCGDGRLGALMIDAFPTIERIVAIDRSEPMLDRVRRRFDNDGPVGEVQVDVVRADLNQHLELDDEFDVVVSGFAIHHLGDTRKRSLFGEITQFLAPGGVFANLDVIRSGTDRRHAEFLAAIGRSADDPEDHLATIEDQLDWMRHAGLVEVDCLWRWRGFALLIGETPGSAHEQPSSLPSPERPA